jgi:hypothetical protein
MSPVYFPDVLHQKVPEGMRQEQQLCHVTPGQAARDLIFGPRTAQDGEETDPEDSGVVASQMPIFANAMSTRLDDADEVDAIKTYGHVISAHGGPRVSRQIMFG